MTTDERRASPEREDDSESEAGETDDGAELADLDPNAEEQARRVERQLRRLRREMRG